MLNRHFDISEFEQKLTVLRLKQAKALKLAETESSDSLPSIVEALNSREEVVGTEQSLMQPQRTYYDLFMGANPSNCKSCVRDSKFDGPEHLLESSFFDVNQKDLNPLTEFISVGESCNEASEDSIVFDSLLELRNELLLNQEQLILLNNYSTNYLARLLQEATLNSNVVSTDFFVQVINSLPLLFTSNNLTLTVASVFSMFHLKHLALILGHLQESVTFEDLKVRVKIFLRFFRPLLVPFSNVLVWTKLSFIGNNSLSSWIINVLHTSIQMYVSPLNSLPDRLIFSSFNLNPVTSVVNFSPHFVSFWYKVNNIIQNGAKYLAVIPARTWFFSVTILLGTGISSLAIYLLIQIVKNPDKALNFLKLYLERLGIPISSGEIVNYILSILKSQLVQYMEQNNFPTSSDELITFFVTEIKKKASNYVENYLEDLISSHYACESVDKRVKEVLDILEDFFY